MLKKWDTVKLNNDLNNKKTIFSSSVHKAHEKTNENDSGVKINKTFYHGMLHICIYIYIETDDLANLNLNVAHSHDFIRIKKHASWFLHG